MRCFWWCYLIGGLFVFFCLFTLCLFLGGSMLADGITHKNNLLIFASAGPAFLCFSCLCYSVSIVCTFMIHMSEGDDT